MRLLACDFDGTLFRGGLVSDEDAEAVARWRAAGHVFGIVTGRGALTLMTELERFPGLVCDFLLCNNGALLLDGRGRETARRPLERDLSRLLLGHGICARCASCAVFDGVSMYILEGKKGWINPVYRPGFLPLEKALEGSFVQISFAFARRSEAFDWGGRLERELAGRAAVHCSISVADVTAPEAGKAAGIPWACAVRGWKPGRVLTAGDDGNDIEMLSAFEGYAMAGSPPEVLSAAEGRTISSVARLVELGLGEPEKGPGEGS